VSATGPAIQQNDFKRQWDCVEAPVLDAVRRVGASGWYILGSEVEAFETELAKLWGIAHAVGTANGLDALEIGLRCLGLRPGDKVLTTPLSAFATTLAILRAGGVPLFVDVDSTGGLDLAQCRELLERDRSIRFLVPVHLYGFALNMKELSGLRDDFGLRVVEDCAQAIGAAAGRIRAGTVGQIAATSFYPTKNLGALGDAGALLTNDAALAQTARELRNYGQSAHYLHSSLGLNSRLDELHAAILRDAFLPNLNSWTAARLQTAQKYREQIRNSAVELPGPLSARDAVWHLFPILVPPGSRERFRAYLDSCAIATAIHYPRLIPDQTALAKAGLDDYSARLSKARRFAECEVSLPIHPFLTDNEIEAVIEACNNWNAG
jgi:dTDP-4-amino-4,6-dideoxygalactose transaminase